jgi:DNA-binding CsgD family transcriptional regulator
MPGRITDDILLDLVGRVYDAAIDPRRWPEFLNAFARAVQAQGTLIYTHNVETSEASTASGGSASLNVAVNFDPEHVRALGEHYNLVNVWAHNEAVLKPGRPVTGSMLYPVRELPKTEFYDGWLRPQDFFHALGGIIVQDGPWATKFSALRSRRAGDYTSDELRLYQELLPHLARAAQLQRRFAFLQSLSSSSLAVLDTVPAAVLLLDACGRVLHANGAAEAELRRADPLELHSSGELHARGGPRAQSALGTAIASALDPIRGTTEKLNAAAQLARRNGETLSVQALPLPMRLDEGRVTAVSQRLAACALLIHGSASRTSTLAPQLLRHVYGLTPAEVQVVLAIAEGDTLKRYAQRRGISRHTAANQLKRAFEKTGMRRQSELVRWMHQCNGRGPSGTSSATGK